METVDAGSMAVAVFGCWAPVATIVAAAGSGAMLASGVESVGAGDDVVAEVVVLGGVAGRIWAFAFRQEIRAAVVVAKNLAKGPD